MGCGHGDIGGDTLSEAWGHCGGFGGGIEYLGTLGGGAWGQWGTQEKSPGPGGGCWGYPGDMFGVTLVARPWGPGATRRGAPKKRGGQKGHPPVLRMSPSGCHRRPDGRQAPSRGGKFPGEPPDCGHKARRKELACDKCDIPFPTGASGPCPSPPPPFLPIPCPALRGCPGCVSLETLSGVTQSHPCPRPGDEQR